MSDLAAARRRFAEEIRSLADLRSPALSRAFAEVPRERFLGSGPWSVWNTETWAYESTPDADPVHVYRDAPIAIDAGRQLNNGQPSFVAKLLDALELRPGEAAVHIGAGTGYFSAVIAAAVGDQGTVTAIELDEGLAERARLNLRAWPRVTVVHANGCEHDFSAADAILVNAGASAPRVAWLDRLRRNGRLVLPLVRWPDREDEAGARGTGIVLQVTRWEQAYAARVIGSVVIFPCIGGIDATADLQFGESLRRFADVDEIRSLRRDSHQREETCWFHGGESCLSFLPPAGA